MIEHFLYLYLRTVLNRSWKELMSATREPARMQSSRLLEIISRNSGTAFGKEHGFRDIRSVDDFRSRVPVRTYEDFKPYISRMLGGENDVLTAEVPQLFGRTSGTTSTPKFIPITPSFYEEFSKMQKMWQRKMVADHRRMLRGKILSSMSPEIDGYTEGGTPYGAMSGHSYLRQYPLAQKRFAVPYEVMCTKDFEAKYYLILRLALEQNIAAIAAMNPSTILLLMRKFHTHAETLARDIANGTIAECFDIEPKLRQRLVERLRPNRERAGEIESLAARGRPIRGTDLWESLVLIITWQAGSVGFFLREFPSYFPGVPIRDMGFIATEGYFSIPLQSDTPNGLLAVTGHFFEFFEVRPDGERDDRPLGCEELEKGKQYYVILTTSGGLYRYDICDIIEVVDFYHNTPLIVFRQKGGNTISITGEKVTEIQVTEAMSAASSSFGSAIEGFTAFMKPDDPPYYLLAIETTERDESVLAGLLDRFEQELHARNLEYAAKRDSQRLGTPVLRLLVPGFFEEWRKERVGQGSPDGQYKTPHLTADTSRLDRIQPVAEVSLSKGSTSYGGRRQ